MTPDPHIARARGTDAPAVDIVGGTLTDPGITELDDAIEQIVSDYVPDSLHRTQLAQRVLAEVIERTGLGPFSRPAAGEGAAAADESVAQPVFVDRYYVPGLATVDSRREDPTHLDPSRGDHDL